MSAQTGFDLFPDRAVIAIRVNGELKDKATTVTETDAVEPVEVDSADGLNILRHSTAHVMAQAVQRINPEARLGIGPPVQDGFYYDFDVAEHFTPDDLAAVSKEMDRIIRSGQRFVRRVVTDDEARAELAGEPYKLELIGLKGGAEAGKDGESVEVGAGELTIYDNVDRDGNVAWKDLCRGPHVPNTGALGAYKLTRLAAAYWRGSEKNPQLQRIYGTAWPTKDELRAYLERLEEAAKRDHRKLGKELDLFSFPDEIGSGLSVWHRAAASSAWRWSSTPGAGTWRRATPTSTRPTSPRRTSSSSRTTSSPTRRGCSRRSSWTRSATRRARSRSGARTTT